MKKVQHYCYLIKKLVINKTYGFFDSGASYHMSGRKLIFTNLDDKIQGNVSFGDSSKLQVEGKGKNQIVSKNGNEEFISHVFYVPGMKSIVLSIGQLLKKGYIIHMEDNNLLLMDKSGRHIAQSKMTNNCMFPLHLNTEAQKSLYDVVENES